MRGHLLYCIIISLVAWLEHRADGRSYPAIFSDQDNIQFYRRRSRRKKPPTGQLIDRRMI
eukprot:scaffold4358_cov58-Skeletonema_marinoi.AAC.1